MQSFERVSRVVVCVLAAGFILAGCGSPEEKRMKFYDKGMALYEEGDYVKARLEFKNAIQIDPKFAKAYYMLAQTEMKAGNFQQAFGFLNKSVELDEDLLDAHAEIGKMLLGAKQTDKAREKMELVLSKDPNHRDGRTLKAILAVSDRKLDDAKALLGELIREDPKDAEPYLLLSGILAGERKGGEAASVLKDLLAQDPSNENARLRLAVILEGQKDLVGAEREYQELIKSDPEKKEYKILLAQFYERGGRQQEAEGIYEKLVADNPDDAKLRAALAAYYVKKEDKDKAVKVLEKAILDLPEAWEVHEFLAKLRLAAEQKEQALSLLDDYMERVKTGPGYLKSKLFKASIVFADKKPDEALALVDQVLEENAADVGAHGLKGDILMAKRDFEGAVAEYRAVVHEQPANIPFTLKLARAHLLNDETAQAEETYKKILQEDEKVREAYAGLIAIYRRQKRPELIKEQLHKVLEIAPKDAAALTSLGDIALAEKKVEEARKYYDRLEEADPKSPAAQFKQGDLLLAGEKTDEALKRYEKALELNPDYLPALNRILTVHVQQQKMDVALARAREQVKKRPANPDFYISLGRLEAMNKEPEKARESFENALELAPESQAPMFQLAQLAQSQGNLDEAIERYRTMRERDRGNQAVGLLLSTLYLQKGDPLKALEVTREVYEANPNSASTANNLAYYYAEFEPTEENLKKALEIIEAPLQKHPDNLSIVDTAAWIHFRMGDYEKAKRLLMTVLDKIEDTPDVNFHLGMIHYKLGEEEKAAERLRIALQGDRKFVGREEAEETLKKLGG